MLVPAMNHSGNNWLVADVGATSSRVAILADGELHDLKIFRNDGAFSLEDLLRDYLSHADATPASCALAVAAPIDGDDIQMCNRNWQFSRQTIAEIGFDRVEIINDFHAIAYALPTFDDDSRIEIGVATAYREGNIAVLGPGSGLGMSAWIDGVAAMSGEGGHITISGRDAREDGIIEKLRAQFGHCSAERVLSGPGIVALHQAMHEETIASPEEITADPDTYAKMETMNQWFRFLGGVAAELALITGAAGGVYIAGGIVPACIDQMRNSDFRSRFEDKNRYREYMRAIPTWVVTDPVPGLSGLKTFIDRDRSAAR